MPTVGKCPNRKSTVMSNQVQCPVCGVINPKYRKDTTVRTVYNPKTIAEFQQYYFERKCHLKRCGFLLAKIIKSRKPLVLTVIGILILVAVITTIGTRIIPTGDSDW